MGQAKSRREALRQRMLEDGAHWDFPPSPWEADICAELTEDRAVVVRRVPPEQLSLMRMPPNQCHANARWYSENDPSQKARMVTGWWVQWPDFLLHSVVDIDGALVCVTPSAFGETEFPFIPDPKIFWIEDGTVYSAVRDGRVIGKGVRRFPEFTMARGSIVRERLLAGVDPYKAIEFSDAEMEELKMKHAHS